MYRRSLTSGSRPLERASTKERYDLKERKNKGKWREDEEENDATSRREISFLRSIYDHENIPVYTCIGCWNEIGGLEMKIQVEIFSSIKKYFEHPFDIEIGMKKLKGQLITRKCFK